MGQVYSHRVQFYETDLMGIVHHSNYLRFMEEARVEWARKLGLMDFQDPMSGYNFAVLETRVRHLKPAQFGDELRIEIQAKLEGVRLTLQYRVIGKSNLLALGETHHVAVNREMKPIKTPASLRQVFKEGVPSWTETWL